MLLSSSSVIVLLPYLVTAAFYTSASTSTSSATSPPSSTSSNLDFGSCNHPGISYGYNLDGSAQYGYAPQDQTQFPQAWSPDVSIIENYICGRLQNDCQASTVAVQTCFQAFEQYSGLSGQSAVDSWNSALGLQQGTSWTGSVTTGGWTTTTAPSTTQSIQTLTSTTVITSFTSSSSGVPSTKTALTVVSTDTRKTTSSLFGSTTSSASTTITTTTRTTVIPAPHTTGADAADTNGSPFTSQNSAHCNRPGVSIVIIGLALTFVLTMLQHPSRPAIYKQNE